MIPYLKQPIAIAASVLCLTATAVQAQDYGTTAERKVDRSLRESLRKSGKTRRVIVTVKPGYRAEIRRALQRHGHVVSSESALVESLAAEVHREDIEELARHPWVDAVSDDADVYAAAAHDKRNGPEKARGSQRGPRKTARALVQSNLRETLGLPRHVTSGTPTGAGVGVAIIDSGIAPLADFAFRISAFYDFTRGGAATRPYDDYGHGTHVAGLIGSSGLQSLGQLTGVAPRVHFIGMKVLDRQGRGSSSTVIQAIEFAVAHRRRLNIHVINLSLGHPIYAPAKDDPLVRAVERATDAGLIVVTSAGNQGAARRNGEPGYTGIMSPGNAPSAITVGATMAQNTVTRKDDRIAPYSSRGPSWFDAFAKPDVVAPGHGLVSDTSIGGELFGQIGGVEQRATHTGFMALSGTSMATAVTSGLAALVVEASSGELSPNVVKAILQYSAIPVSDADPLTQGAGQVNAEGATRLAAAIDTSTPQGHWWLRHAVQPASVIGGASYSWAGQVIWGDDVLGGDLLSINERAWSLEAQWGDDNIVWGTDYLQDDNIVWGTTSVWAAHLAWKDRLVGMSDDDNIVWGTDDNIVWGTLDFDNIVWGTCDDDNIVWGTWDDDNIVWGTSVLDDIIWGSTDDDNIVWGTDDFYIPGVDDNIVWGTGVKLGGQF